MIDKIYDHLKFANYKSEPGRFLSDKSYKFDTIFFMSNFILKFMNKDFTFDYHNLRDSIIKFTSDIFNLKIEASGNINFFLETISLLKFARIIEEKEKGKIVVRKLDFLEFICESIENSYIFQYILTYVVFKNSNILDSYYKYVISKGNEKAKILSEMKMLITAQSNSVIEEETVWSNNYVKFSIMVLALANKDNKITRTLNILDEKVTPDDLAANKAGTKTPGNMSKNNSYLKEFNLNYVLKSINKFLVNNFSSYSEKSENTISSLAKEICDLKLDIIATQLIPIPNIINDELYKDEQIKARNQKLQRKFREKLLSSMVNKCVVCGLGIKDLLVAAHIVPYSKCELIYDAVNDMNGLLLCPNHDKLFEGGKFMTINFKTGEILLSEKIKNEELIVKLNGKTIDKSLINSERRHYLKWHNDEFEKLNK